MGERVDGWVNSGWIDGWVDGWGSPIRFFQAPSFRILSPWRMRHWGNVNEV